MYRKIYALFLFLLFSTVGVQAADSMLSSGRWFKVGLTETGVYRLTYSDLSSLGIDVDHINPKNIRLFHNGGGVLAELNAQPRIDDLKEIPIVVVGENDGRFDRDDYVLFYARGPVTWNYNSLRNTFVHVPNAYDDYSYAFITIDLGEGKRLQTAATPTGSVDVNVSEFLDYQVFDDDRYNIINGGRTYYGEIIDGNGSWTKVFSFPNLKTNRICSVAVDLAGRNFKSASFQMYANDALLKTIAINTTAAGSNHTFAHEASGTATFQSSGNAVKMTLTHVGVPGTTSIGYIDDVEVNAWRSLSFTGGQMLFRNPEDSIVSKVYNFQLSGASSAVQVWDVSDSVCPVKVGGQLSGSVYSFKMNGKVRNEFVAFDGSSFHNPVLMGEVDN